MTTMTNYEKIRAMSAEEMAAIIICPHDLGTLGVECVLCPDGEDCITCSIKWLNSEVEE